MMILSARKHPARRNGLVSGIDAEDGKAKMVMELLRIPHPKRKWSSNGKSLVY